MKTDTNHELILDIFPYVGSWSKCTLTNQIAGFEGVDKEFDVTRERIRQIEAKALRKLRHPSRSKKLKDYLEL